jgi:hypothetical protein
MPLAQAKNGDKQFWKIKVPYSQWKAQHGLMRGAVFFFLRRGGGGIFSFFSYVPYEFPICFPKTFPIAPHLYPTWFCPKFNTLMYIKVSHREYICSWLSIEVLLLWSAQCSKNKWWWANRHGSFKNTKCECTHELINMNRNIGKREGGCFRLFLSKFHVFSEEKRRKS